MVVREAQPQDAAEVASVNVRSWQVAYRGLFPDDYLDRLRAEDRMAHYTFGDARPDGPTTLVAVVDATLCGFVATGSSRDEDAAGAGQVYALYVDPQAWGGESGDL
jgi:ribosomal protein S18 acetylase RimI-like enzyme